MNTVLALTLVGIVLAAIAVGSRRLAAYFRERGRLNPAEAERDEAIAKKLDAAHELAHVIAQVLDGHEHGETVIQAVLDATKSPEAQDLFQTVITKVRG